jgi:hypothetical protein
MAPAGIVTARHLSYRDSVYASADTPSGMLLGGYSVMRAAP